LLIGALEATVSLSEALLDFSVNLGALVSSRSAAFIAIWHCMVQDVEVSLELSILLLRIGFGFS
jgi:hypothetical protein